MPDMGKVRALALIAAAFFGALLVMYRFDFGMTVAVFVIGIVFLAAMSVRDFESATWTGWTLGQFFRLPPKPKPPSGSDD
jgi:cell division protein FtsW (lipid II flippase)